MSYVSGKPLHSHSVNQSRTRTRVGRNETVCFVIRPNLSVALLPLRLGVIVCSTSSRGFSGRNPSSSDGSSLPTLSSNSYRTRGVGVTYRRDPVPVEIVERYARYYPDRDHVLFHLVHRGASIELLTRLDIDGCAMSYPGFHLAHGERLRPIDFARGYGIIPTTLSQTLSIG